MAIDVGKDGERFRPQDEAGLPYFNAKSDENDIWIGGPGNDLSADRARNLAVFQDICEQVRDVCAERSGLYSKDAPLIVHFQVEALSTVLTPARVDGKDPITIGRLVHELQVSALHKEGAVKLRWYLGPLDEPNKIGFALAEEHGDVIEIVEYEEAPPTT